MSKYGDVIKKARKQASQKETQKETQKESEPKNQKSGLPDAKAEEVNLSIKVPKRLRRHWAAEAKRRDTTMTAVVIAALTEKFGEPDGP